MAECLRGPRAECTRGAREIAARIIKEPLIRFIFSFPFHAMNDLSSPLTNSPENFQMAEGYACYRPVAQVSFQGALDLACTAIAYARENRIRKLLVDSTLLTGFGSPAVWERFEMGMQCAAAARALVIVALVMKAEFIDPDRFGVKVARNRGLHTNVFATEDEAREWLLDPQTRQGAD